MRVVRNRLSLVVGLCFIVNNIAAGHVYASLIQHTADSKPTNSYSNLSPEQSLNFEKATMNRIAAKQAVIDSAYKVNPKAMNIISKNKEFRGKFKQTERTITEININIPNNETRDKIFDASYAEQPRNQFTVNIGDDASLAVNSYVILNVDQAGDYIIVTQMGNDYSPIAKSIYDANTHEYLADVIYTTGSEPSRPQQRIEYRYVDGALTESFVFDVRDLNGAGALDVSNIEITNTGIEGEFTGELQIYTQFEGEAGNERQKTRFELRLDEGEYSIHSRIENIYMDGNLDTTLTFNTTGIDIEDAQILSEGVEIAGGMQLVGEFTGKLMTMTEFGVEASIRITQQPRNQFTVNIGDDASLAVNSYVILNVDQAGDYIIVTQMGNDYSPIAKSIYDANTHEYLADVIYTTGSEPSRPQQRIEYRYVDGALTESFVFDVRDLNGAGALDVSNIEITNTGIEGEFTGELQIYTQFEGEAGNERQKTRFELRLDEGEYSIHSRIENIYMDGNLDTTLTFNTTGIDIEDAQILSEGVEIAGGMQLVGEFTGKLMTMTEFGVGIENPVNDYKLSNDLLLYYYTQNLKDENCTPYATKCPESR